MTKAWRVEYLEICRRDLATAEAKLAARDYQVDPADDLAALVGASTEGQRINLENKIAALRAGIARAEASSDAEFGESWQ